MSDIVCIATLVLAAIAQASLQLGIGGLILLYHNSLGKHRRRKTRFLARNYILGTCAISFLAICAFCYLISNFFSGALRTEWLVICVGALVACAAIMWIFYYRGGKQSTELWLPKSITNFIRRKARKTDDGIEAFSLGLLSGFAELPISVAICFVVANSVLNLSAQWQVLAVAAYIFATTLPMLVLRIKITTGQSAVDAQKWRVRNKAFARIISGSSFMLLAIFIVAFWVM